MNLKTHKMKVLFLAANPIDTSRLRLDEECREIEHRILLAQKRDTISLVNKGAVRIGDLQLYLNQEKPSIVHFSGHGSRRNRIFLEDDFGNAKDVPPDALERMFDILKDDIKCVVLNACFSLEQARAINQHIDCVVGMSSSIEDKAAIVFSAAFYLAIASGRSVKNAFDQGITELMLQGLSGKDVPQLLTRDGEDASCIFLLKSKLSIARQRTAESAAGMRETTTASEKEEETLSWKTLKDKVDRCTLDTLQRLKEKYYARELYVERTEVEKRFIEFRASDKTGFIVIGESGYGKTNLLCHLVEDLQENDLVLFYRGWFIKPNIKEQLLDDLCPSPKRGSTTCFDDFCREVADLLDKEAKSFFIFIDAVNENGDSALLLRNIDELVSQIDSKRIRVVLTCRTVIWNIILNATDFLYDPKYYTVHGDRENRLVRFTDEELKEVFERYKRRFQLRTELSQLSKRTRDSCAVPVFLRMISEVYAGESIPPYVPVGSVFDTWFKKKVKLTTDMQALLDKIVAKMEKNRSSILTVGRMTDDRYIADCIKDSGPDSPYIKLLDRGVLVEEERNPPVIRFTFDKLFEYLLANRLLPKDRVCNRKTVLKLVSRAENFNSIFGAIKIALMLRKDKKLFSELAKDENYETRKILVDTLATISEDDLDLVTNLLKEWLKSGTMSAKRTAIQTIYEMPSPPLELLEVAMLATERSIRSLATQYAYLVWQRGGDKSFRILKDLVTAARSRLNRRAFEVALEYSLNIMLIKHSDEQAMAALYDQWVSTLQEFFAFSPSRSGARNFFKRKARDIIAVVGTSIVKNYIEKLWYADKTKLWSFFKLPKGEKDIVANYAKYLDPYTEGPPDFEKIVLRLLKHDSPIHQALGFGLLAVRSMNDFECCLPFLDSLWSHTDVSCRSAALGTFSLVCWNMPDRTTKIIDDFLSGDIYEEVRVFGWFLSNVAMIFARTNQQEEILPIVRIIEKASERHDTVILKRVVTELGNTGVIYPESALQTLRYVFDTTEKEIREALIESLIKIRTVRLDLTEKYLSQKAPALLEDIKDSRAEANISLAAVMGVDMVFLVLFDFPYLRDLFLNALSRISEFTSEKKFLRFCVRKFLEGVVAYDGSQDEEKSRVLSHNSHMQKNGRT